MSSCSVSGGSAQQRRSRRDDLIAVPVALTAIATLFPAIAGAGLCLGWRDPLYWIIPAVIASIYLSIGYAWIFAIEIPRRRESEKN